MKIQIINLKLHFFLHKNIRSFRYLAMCQDIQLRSHKGRLKISRTFNHCLIIGWNLKFTDFLTAIVVVYVSGRVYGVERRANCRVNNEMIQVVENKFKLQSSPKMLGRFEFVQHSRSKRYILPPPPPTQCWRNWCCQWSQHGKGVKLPKYIVMGQDF